VNGRGRKDGGINGVYIQTFDRQNINAMIPKSYNITQ